MIERPCINANADGNPALACRRHDLFDALRPSDVPGVDAQSGNPLCHCLKRELIIKMNIGNEGCFHLPNDIAEILCRLHIGDRKTHDIASRRCELTNLLYGRLRIRCLCIAHGLHGNGRAASDGNCSDMNLPRFAAFINWHREGQPPAKIRTTSFFIASSMSRMISPTPAFWI